MQAEEKREMLELLETGRQVFLQAVDGVTEEAAALSPAPERWSVLQCVEHVAVVEDFLFQRITGARQAPDPMINEQREAAIRRRAADRSRAVAAPEGSMPNGRFSSLSAAVDHFLRCRARTIQFVENSSTNLRCGITTHPLLGTVNCYETLLMIAEHPKRHAAQIAEARAATEKRA